MRKARGVTLLEVMIVVTIVGILSAVAAGGLRSLLTQTRVAQSGRVLASAFRTARLRAIATGCPHFVQVNGPTYGGLGPVGFQWRPNTVSVMRKGDCTQVDANFAAGDVLIDSFKLHDGDVNSVRITAPATLVAGGQLLANSFAVGYDRLATRNVWADSAGGGHAAFADITATVPAVIPLTIQSSLPDAAPGGTLSIPTLGSVRYP